MKKLYRSREDKIFAGVVGGLGKFFEIDSTILRLIWVLVVIFTGIFPGVIVYILAVFVVPPEPMEKDIEKKIAEE